MSLALARKYRPRTFNDLVGQDSVRQTLSQALDSNRLSHAYLFSGLRGSGKTSTARIFAKALLCEKGPSSKPCEECIHCQMANENRHMDIIEMDAASNRGIDDIKELIEHTKYKPSSGRFKIFIIDEVHMLTPQAFNALLKTLEEPPDFVKFILATTDPLKLPATILSRTQHFRFKKIPQKLIIAHLEHILNFENIGYDNQAIEIIARNGAGSLRDSLTLLDQAIVYGKSYIGVDTVTQMLGIIEPGKLEELFDSISQKDIDKIKNFIKEAGDYEVEMIIDEMILYLKNLLFLKDFRFDTIILDRFFRILAEAKELLFIGSDGEFVLGLTLLKMVEALKIKDIDEMIETLQNELCVNTKSIKESINPSVTPTRQEVQNTTPPIESKKAENAISKEDKGSKTKFLALIEKLYDRDAELGECFEKNITFKKFNGKELIWESTAEGKDKKVLIQHWSLIRTFVQEIFGLQTNIVNIAKKNISQEPKKKLQEEEKDNIECKLPDNATSSSTIENIEIPNSCMNPDTGSSEASKEIDPQKLMEEPMIKKAVELFNPQKVRIQPKS